MNVADPRPVGRYNTTAMFFRSRRKLSTHEAHDLAPVRAPLAVSEAVGDEIQVTIRRSPGRLARAVSLFFTLPPTRTFRLDPFGARVWNMCDGRTTVGAIAAALARDHGWPADRAEHAVLAFLLQLSERQLVGFAP